MNVIPQDVLEKLEFDKVLALLELQCRGELGRMAIRTLVPETEPSLIIGKLDRVAEAKAGIDEAEEIPLGQYFDSSDAFRQLEIVDYVLDTEQIVELTHSLRLMDGIYGYFTESRQRKYPKLYQIIEDTPWLDTLIVAIDRVIDEEGLIRADASPELMRIRKMILSKQREVDRVFNGLIIEFKQKGWLTDNAETFRNGRRVLSVPAEHKRKIRGLIHDESASGKTAFMEPEAVMDINNDIFDFQQEERREIYRILKELSARLRPHLVLLKKYQSLLIRFDIILAKARLAALMNAHRPEVIDRPFFNFVRAFHPLLLIKNDQLDKETVPFYLELTKGNRILMLSGPNAGGKSITLKSVGLLQLMVQTGLLVPADPASTFGIFHQIFADIGDQQSLEDDLSTYSSRLENARRFVENANQRTLVLIDEFGSGTDPKFGGAIAEAVLQQLHKMKVWGVITTHYSILKVYAFKTKGIVNGSMHFDQDSLSPTFQLQVGRPGSSYAFEIAEKSGLDDKVLKYARRRVGKAENAIDQMVIDLQREKQELEEKLLSIYDREHQLDKLIKNYEHLQREFDVRRKRMKLENKERDLNESAHLVKSMENLIREIREEQNLEKAKALAEQARAKRDQQGEKVEELREEVYHTPVPGIQQRAIKEGDYVRLKSGGAVGQVESIQKNVATIVTGLMRMQVKVRDLELAKAPLEVRSTRSVQVTSGKSNRMTVVPKKLDIRGMRVLEAIKMVEDYVDRALLQGVSGLEIVHGRGNGSLRKAVRTKLREYQVPLEMEHPAPDRGGDGVTLVRIL